MEVGGVGGGAGEEAFVAEDFGRQTRKRRLLISHLIHPCPIVR